MAGLRGAYAWGAPGRHHSCDGDLKVEGFDGDYALLIGGLLDLHAAGGGSKWLAWAYKLQQAMDMLFWDGNVGETAP